MNRLALIIPTKNRPRELSNLLENIEKQDSLPSQIIVVDVSDTPQTALISKFIKVRPDYIHFLPPNMVKQRTEGINKLNPDITLVGFLDDDILFHPGSLKKMLEFFEMSGPGVGGAVFNSRGSTGQERMFFINALLGKKQQSKGRLLSSGFTTPICPAAATQEVNWLFGGATVWRKEVFNEFKFDPWFQGHGYLEDLDFSFRVGEKYKMYVVHDALFDHLHSATGKISGIKFGSMVMENRYHIVLKRSYFSKRKFFLASTIMFIKSVIYGILKINKNDFLLSIGYVKGLLKCLSGKVD
jgi:glycosyltransferase involved in cell wall biosynthesis